MPATTSADDFLGKVAAVVIGAAMVAAITAAAVLYQGWISSIIWNWFMPQLFGLPQLTVLQAIALCLAISAIKPGTTYKNHEVAWQSLFAPLIFLGAAWVVKGML